MCLPEAKGWDNQNHGKEVKSIELSGTLAGKVGFLWAALWQDHTRPLFARLCPGRCQVSTQSNGMSDSVFSTEETAVGNGFQRVLNRSYAGTSTRSLPKLRRALVEGVSAPKSPFTRVEGLKKTSLCTILCGFVDFL